MVIDELKKEYGEDAGCCHTCDHDNSTCWEILKPVYGECGSWIPVEKKDNNDTVG